MNSLEEYPKENTFPANIKNKCFERKKQYFDKVISKFVEHYIFQQGQAPPVGEQDDFLRNYSLCTVYLTVNLLQPIDTAKEGDGDRNLINQKILLSIPFLFLFFLLTFS